MGTRRPVRRAILRYRKVIFRLFRQRTLGERGESAAVRHLRRKGYSIVARRCRIGRKELDIVAVDQRTVVFVEVKTRRSHDAGAGIESVEQPKQTHLSRAALQFLRRHDLLGVASRFDVIGVTWPEGSKRPTIDHIVNAFPSLAPQGLY